VLKINSAWVITKSLAQIVIIALQVQLYLFDARDFMHTDYLEDHPLIKIFAILDVGYTAL
jgi:hypothetical protein